jgi:hypothetical protein
MKVLQVVFYPLDNPRHGGQLRCQQINRWLRARGHQVTILSILGVEGIRTHLGPQINIPNKFREEYLGTLADDFPYAAYAGYFSTPVGAKELSRALKFRDFDVVWEDHPYIHGPLKTLQVARGAKPMYVYSSHNVEHQLVTDILADRKFKQDSNLVTSRVLEAVRSQEKQAVQDADAVVGVTLTDLEVLSKWNPQAKLIHAPNASRAIRAKSTDTESVLSFIGLSQYALFVGSGHPPNAQGFLNMLGLTLEYLAPDFRIVCVGGASWAIKEAIQKLGSGELPFSRLVLLDEVADEVLNDLRKHATVVLLPIISGGGSNLKTAEALLGPSRILATSKSFRGFEDYYLAEGVEIIDNPLEYRKRLSQISRAMEEHNFCRHEIIGAPLTWDRALSSLGEIFVRSQV